MAQQHPTTHEPNVESGEVQDRGVLDFLEKKEDENKPEEELSVPEFAKEHVQKAEEKKEEEEHHPLDGSIEQLPRSQSSGSSSDEEEGKKKKKGVKDQIKEKITRDKEEENKANGAVHVDGEVETEEKKGLMEKMKEKLPAGHKKTEVVDPLAAAPVEQPEKKGFLDKVKEKIPAHHPTEEEKEKTY